MKTPYRLIIVDDEEPARDLIEFFTSQISDLICVAVCNSAIQAIEALHKFKPDLMILDICMPEMSGLDLITLRLPNCPDTILATAYPEFAAKSYEFSVLDYLVKPIPFERFSQSIEKFRRKRHRLEEVFANQGPSGAESESDYSKALLQPNQNAATSVWLREEKRLMQIPYECIFYVEGSKDYIKVYLKDHFVLTGTFPSATICSDSSIPYSSSGSHTPY
jgi:DNA-binding LytR/AlgR family response regulator